MPCGAAGRAYSIRPRVMPLDFRMLGPLEVYRDGYSLPLGGAKQKSVLAILVVHVGQLVSVDTLVDCLWDDAPPNAATNVVQTYVSRLRRVLSTTRTAAADVLKSRSGGYVLDVSRESVDLFRLEDAVDEARKCLRDGAAMEARTALSEALSMFTGTPLAEFRYDRWAQGELERIEELRVGALETRIDADLALGEHASVITELDALIRQHPLREHLRWQLMLALYRSGRQADALEVYRSTQGELSEQLGIDPSPALRDLERRVLTQDPSLESTPRLREAEEGPAPGSVQSKDAELTDPLPTEGVLVRNERDARIAMQPPAGEPPADANEHGTTTSVQRSAHRRRPVIAAAIGIGLLAGALALVYRDDGKPIGPETPSAKTASESSAGNPEVTLERVSREGGDLTAAGGVSGLPSDWIIRLIATDDPDRRDWKYSPPASMDEDAGHWTAAIPDFGELYDVQIALFPIPHGAGTWATGGQLSVPGIGEPKAELETAIPDAALILDLPLPPSNDQPESPSA